jgi:hypothetical protein
LGNAYPVTTFSTFSPTFSQRKVIDVATQAGANSVNRLTFALRDERAEALAVSVKGKLGRLLRVEEGQPVIISPAREEM